MSRKSGYRFSAKDMRKRMNRTPLARHSGKCGAQSPAARGPPREPKPRGQQGKLNQEFVSCGFSALVDAGHRPASSSGTGRATMDQDASKRKFRTLNIIAGAGALAWMSVGPALAADIPAAPVYKAPVAAP